MHLASPLVGLLAAAATLAGIADAKYFSEGWKPGQPTTAVNAQATPYALPNVVPKAKTPRKRPEPPRSFTDKALLKVASLAGMKIPSLTDESSLDRYTWANDDKEGIDRLTDDNWEEEVEYEHIPFGEERVWIIILHGPPRDPLTPMFYDAHTNATALARKHNDLPHVRWARIDYITESILSTRWLVFKPPYLVIVTDRGQTIRFLHPQEIVPDGELLYRFVKEREWAKLPVWRSEWAPGGSRAWIVNLWISLSTGYTKLTGGIPSWIVLIATGMITQSLLKLMHTGRARVATPAPAPAPASKAAKSD